MIKRLISSLSLRLVTYVMFAQIVILVLLLSYRGLLNQRQGYGIDNPGMYVALEEISLKHKLPDPNNTYLQSEIGGANIFVLPPGNEGQWDTFLINNPDLWYLVKRDGETVKYGNVPAEVFKFNEKRPLNKKNTKYCELQNTMSVISDRPAMHFHLNCNNGTLNWSVGGVNLDYNPPSFNERRQAWSFLGVKLEFVLYIVLALILFAPLSIYILLRPVRRASAMAETFKPGMDKFSLPTDSVPSEILGLIKAVNGAFERVNLGYRRERHFRNAMAHELRTPLTILRARLDEVGDEPLRHQLVEDVRSMRDLVTRLLNLAEVTSSSDNIEKTDLNNVVAKAISDCKDVLEAAGQAIKVEHPKRPVYVYLHKDVCVLALVNLIHNAIEHGASPSPIIITIRRSHEILIRDHGPGLKAISGLGNNNSSYSNTESAALYGVGLNIVETACQAMNAKLDLSNADGGGLLAKITFDQNENTANA